MRFNLTAVLMIVLLVAGAMSAYSQQQIPNDLEITLERTMCFGWCPAYILAITSDGVVKFTPTRTYVYRGDGATPSVPLTGRITASQVQALTDEFEKIGFFSLQKRYGRAGSSATGRSCPHYWTDHPSAFITLVRNGRRKSVGHYLGCNGTKLLDDLVALEEKIDEIAGTKQWTSQFGWGAANVTDLKLTVNPSTRPASAQKP